jgi:hypothetical protein
MMKLPVSIFQKIRHKCKYGLLMETLFDRLADWGLFIEPYLVFQEGLFGKKPEEFTLEFGEHETTFLNPEDMKKIDQIDGRGENEATLRKRLEKGNKCFAVKIGGKIVGFTWCNFDTFNHRPQYEFKLKENEAYLFDAFILRAYRGLNLAPLMRLRCYQELEKMGRSVLYSVSYYFNTPAIRFKKKLYAQAVNLCLYIRLGKRFHWHRKLRSYKVVHLQQTGD